MDFGTFHLAVFGFRCFPLAFHDYFSRSSKEPVTRSCHLYTAHPTASKQVSSVVIPRPTLRLGFDVTWFANDASSVVHLRSPPCYLPRKVFTSLSIIVHYLSVSLKAASSGLLPEPALRARWAYHHLFRSYEQSSSNRASIVDDSIS